jgi:hypothetical protein
MNVKALIIICFFLLGFLSLTFTAYAGASQKESKVCIKLEK